MVVVAVVVFYAYRNINIPSALLFWDMQITKTMVNGTVLARGMSKNVCKFCHNLSANSWFNHSDESSLRARKIYRRPSRSFIFSPTTRIDCPTTAISRTEEGGKVERITYCRYYLGDSETIRKIYFDHLGVRYCYNVGYGRFYKLITIYKFGEELKLWKNMTGTTRDCCLVVGLFVLRDDKWRNIILKIFDPIYFSKPSAWFRGSLSFLMMSTRTQYYRLLVRLGYAFHVYLLDWPHWLIRRGQFQPLLY